MSHNFLNDKNIVFHLSQQIGEDLLFDILKEAKLTDVLDNGTNLNNYLATEHIVIDIDNAIAYVLNPFDDTASTKVNLLVREKNIKISKLGILSPMNKYLKRKKIERKDVNDFLTNIINYAIDNNISDIHINPRNDSHIAFSFRKDGRIMIATDIYDISYGEYELIANRVLDSAKCNTGTYNKFVEGHIDSKKFRPNSNENISIRMQMNPTVYSFNDGKMCPAFVLRIHKKQANFIDLEHLGLLDSQRNILESFARRNSGLLIVSGPTGSGKTTTLHAILAKAIKADNKTMTIEDPVEIVVAGNNVSQLNINKAAGVTWEESLKAVLRSDVDNVLVGEIRDPITAAKAVEVNQVGHLVLATIHTKNTLLIIRRIINLVKKMNIKKVDVIDALNILMSTRLVQQVCPYCSTEIEVGKNQYISEKYMELVSHHLYSKIRIENNNGCSKCNQGFKGRLLVAEIFVVDHTAERMLMGGATNEELIKHFKGHGNMTIWSHGFNLLFQGKTTISALEKVLPVYSSFGENFNPDEHKKI